MLGEPGRIDLPLSLSLSRARLGGDWTATGLAAGRATGRATGRSTFFLAAFFLGRGFLEGLVFDPAAFFFFAAERAALKAASPALSLRFGLAMGVCAHVRPLLSMSERSDSGLGRAQRPTESWRDSGRGAERMTESRPSTRTAQRHTAAVGAQRGHREHRTRRHAK